MVTGLGTKIPLLSAYCTLISLSHFYKSFVSPKSSIFVQETFRDVLLAYAVVLGRGQLVHDAGGVVQSLHDAPT